MAGSLGNDDEGIHDINVTPFVDVVLVLLVIFMVTAGFIMNKGVKVELPQASTAEAIADQTTFNVIVQREGSFLLNGDPVTAEKLFEAGSQAKQKGEKVVVMISADKGVVYSAVVGVMDTLRRAGVADFALQLETTTEKQ